MLDFNSYFDEEPLHFWERIEAYVSSGTEFPESIRQYLGSVATQLLSLENPTPQDIKNALGIKHASIFSRYHKYEKEHATEWERESKIYQVIEVIKSKYEGMQIKDICIGLLEDLNAPPDRKLNFPGRAYEYSNGETSTGPPACDILKRFPPRRYPGNKWYPWDLEKIYYKMLKAKREDRELSRQFEEQRQERLSQE